MYGDSLTQQMNIDREGFFILTTFYALAPNTQCLEHIGDHYIVEYLNG